MLYHCKTSASVLLVAVDERQLESLETLTCEEKTASRIYIVAQLSGKKNKVSTRKELD